MEGGRGWSKPTSNALKESGWEQVVGVGGHGSYVPPPSILSPYLSLSLPLQTFN